MPTKISTSAIERSTYALVVSFADEAGAPLTPNDGLTWTLMTKAGAVVNGRLAVPIVSAEAITIVLHGDDLVLTAGESKTRKVLIEGTFDSDLGTGLEIRDEVTFSIINLTEAIE